VTEDSFTNGNDNYIHEMTLGQIRENKGPSVPCLSRARRAEPSMWWVSKRSKTPIPAAGDQGKTRKTGKGKNYLTQPAWFRISLESDQK